MDIDNFWMCDVLMWIKGVIYCIDIYYVIKVMLYFIFFNEFINEFINVNKLYYYGFIYIFLW